MLQANTSTKNITKIWTKSITGVCIGPQRAAQAAETEGAKISQEREAEE